MLINSKFRILISLLLLLLISVPSTYSQSTSYLDSLDGKFALQFQITDNFTLSDFQGTIFSGKYHFSKRDAIRLGLMLEFADSELESEISRLDTIDTDEAKEDLSSIGFTINAQYIRYLTITDDIALFLGTGPFVNFFDNTSERIINYEGNEYLRKSTRTGYTIGLDMLIGTEWWFHKQMSLSAEYGLKLSYRSSEDNFSDDVTEATANITSFFITDNNIKFGITVYF